MIVGISMGLRDLSDPWTGFTQFTLLEEKNLLKDKYTWSRWEINDKNSLHAGQIIYGQKSGKSMGKKCQAEGEAKVVWRKDPSGETHENCEGFISLSLRTRNLRRPSRMLVRNWKHQWLLLCPAKLWRRFVGVVHPIKLKENLRVFWKLVNLQDCVWENHYRLIMKIILQEKEKIHCSITIWCTNLFLCPKPWKFQQQKQQWTRNGKNWRKYVPLLLPRRMEWPRRTLGKSEVLALADSERSVRPESPTSPCQHHSIHMPPQPKGRVGGQRRNHTLPKGSVNHGQAATG